MLARVAIDTYPVRVEDGVIVRWKCLAEAQRRMKAFCGRSFPTLLAALLDFDVSFMTWVLLGPLAPFLREDMGLTATQQGLVTAIPLLGGSLFRPALGMLGDRIGGRRTGMIGMRSRCSRWRRLAVRHDAPLISTCSACCLVSPAPASPWRCRWPAAGIRRSIKDWRWASPAPATPVRCWPRSLRRVLPSAMAGRAPLDWRSCRCWQCS